MGEVYLAQDTVLVAASRASKDMLNRMNLPE